MKPADRDVPECLAFRRVQNRIAVRGLKSLEQMGEPFPCKTHPKQPSRHTAVPPARNKALALLVLAYELLRRPDEVVPLGRSLARQVSHAVENLRHKAQAEVDVLL